MNKSYSNVAITLEARFLSDHEILTLNQEVNVSAPQHGGMRHCIHQWLMEWACWVHYQGLTTLDKVLCRHEHVRHQWYVAKKLGQIFFRSWNSRPEPSRCQCTIMVVWGTVLTPMIVAVGLLGPWPRSDNSLQATYTLGTCHTSMMCLCEKSSQIFVHFISASLQQFCWGSPWALEESTIHLVLVLTNLLHELLVEGKSCLSFPLTKSWRQGWELHTWCPWFQMNG